MSLRWWPAPAKVNLFLHVNGRRSDGFHSLQTVFQLLDFCDEIAIEPTRDGRIERVEGPPGVSETEDLCVRAAAALQPLAPAGAGARLWVRKRIPMGGGLGGGSTDAATVLRALDRLWGLQLPLERLAALGLRLGSDVPVFVRGETAWGEGRGEILDPIVVPARWFLLIDPRVQVRTAEIFQAPELTRNSPVLTIRAFSPEQTRNDCEPVVRARYPEIGAALDWLGRFAPARLSGTGACVFASFADAAAAERVAARVPDVWRAHVARGVQRSPMLDALAGA